MNNHSKPAQVPQLVARLAPAQIYQLVGGLLHSEALFVTARQSIQLEHFSQYYDTPARAVWAAATRIADLHGLEVLFQNRAAAMTAVEAEAKAYCQANPDMCSVDSWNYLFAPEHGYLRWIYKDTSPENFHHAYISGLLQAFLRERSVNDYWRDIIKSVGEGQVVANLPELAAAVADRSAAVSGILAQDVVRSAAPEGWLPPPVRRKPSGIKWLDRFLRGGHAAGEAYLMLGAIGSGKTTFGLQLLTAAAENEWLFHSSPEARELAGLPPTDGYEVGYCYYFHYEMSETDIRLRLWSGASRIEFDRISHIGTPGFSLSDAPNLKVEDLAMLARVRAQSGLTPAGGSPPDIAFPSERDRFNQAMYLLRHNVCQIDCMSGPVGKGYIAEIAAILRAERQRGRKIALVVIDYATACVARVTNDQKQQYSLLDMFGQKVESEIAVPFETPVWVLQQLSGESNKRTAANRPGHADARGCSTMGMSFSFAFGIGTTDEKTGCRYFHCSKARRAELGKPPILKIAGGYNRLIDVSDEFYFDSAGKLRSHDHYGGGPASPLFGPNGQSPGHV